MDHIVPIELIDGASSMCEQIDLTILNDLYGTQLALADVVSSRYSHPDIQVFLQPQSGFE